MVRRHTEVSEEVRMGFAMARPPSILMGAVKVYRFLRGLSSFAGRVVVLSFFLSLLLSFLWSVGNAQEFQDATQELLLDVLRWSLLVEIVSGCWLFVLLAMRVIVERRAFLWRWALALLATAASVLMLASLQFLQAWLRA